ncbi:MAG: helix-turn-helix transcriptional regulator [Lachnospiraceae bacterium]|nr:helix-turn-helix transcriptional regulator [Lachnospiraceae bacterium]
MYKYNYIEIGERIRKEREKLELSQDELLDKIRDKKKPCIGRNTLSKLENGDQAAFNAISIAKLTSICEVFNCSISYLMGEYSFRNYDNKFICEQTGLSEESVEKLKHWNDLALKPDRGYAWARNSIRAINDLFSCDIWFSHDVLNQIANYCYYRNVYENPNTKNKERTKALQRFQLALFNATNGLSDCIKDIFKNQKAPDTN